MSTWRSTAAIRTMLLSAAASAAGFGGYSYATTGPLPAHNATVATFSTADAGACLNWNDKDGAIVDFQQTDCAGDHRFEVSSRENLSSYPTSEFAEHAAMPDLARQAQLREELCLAPTLSYLSGTFDPLGKYSVASILPPQDAWDKGDRTLLCGLQATDDQGHVTVTTGKVASQDQSRVSQPGQCIMVDAASATHEVPCEQPHQLETTQIVDLLAVFPDTVPSIEDQDAHLRKTCTQAAKDYLGGDDPLYYSTLQPFWTTIGPNSWTGGSHSVNCALVFAQDGHFATLTGSAKGEFLINDAPPEARPERAPVINPEALDALNQP